MFYLFKCLKKKVFCFFISDLSSAQYWTCTLQFWNCLDKSILKFCIKLIKINSFIMLTAVIFIAWFAYDYYPQPITCLFFFIVIWCLHHSTSGSSSHPGGWPRRELQDVHYKHCYWCFCSLHFFYSIRIYVMLWKLAILQ